MQAISRHLCAQSLAAIFLLLAVTRLHATEDHTVSVIFFTDHAIEEEQWSRLFAAIQAERVDARNKATPLPDAHLDLLRGDRMQPGIIVSSAVSVYLHGDCSRVTEQTYHAPSLSAHPEALGWVQRTNHQITPFIHINCVSISRLLRPSSFYLSGDRNHLISTAVARVFLHEWIHIATQDPRHSANGIEKAVFTAADIGQPQAAHPRETHPEGLSLPSPIHGK